MSLESARYLRPAWLTLAWSGSAVAQDGGGGSFPWGLAILLAAVVAVAATVWRSRAARREADASEAGNGYGPPPADPWGRPPGYGSEPGYGPAQPGMGRQVMGGLATGLAMGAGAVAAQEIGRHMVGGQGQQGMPAGGHAAPQSDSPLARDAGIDAIDGAAAGPASQQRWGTADEAAWDDGDSMDLGGMDDDGGGWDT
jgi:hypothetical protein